MTDTIDSVTGAPTVDPERLQALVERAVGDFGSSSRTRALRWRSSPNRSDPPGACSGHRDPASTRADATPQAA